MLQSMIRVALVAAVAFIQAVLLPAPAHAQNGGLRLSALSSRPEFVSGGDVLVRVDVPAGTAMNGVKVSLNGADVTGKLRADAGGRSLTGVIDGLTPGSNQMTATSGNLSARLALVNHPDTGPILSSPQEQPFVCMTERFKLRPAARSGRPLDANCSIATRVDYVYRATRHDRFQAADGSEGGSGGRRDGYRERPAGAVRRPDRDRHDQPRASTRSRCCTTRRPTRRPTSPRAPPAGTAGSSTRSAAAASPGWYQQGASTGGVDDDVHLRQGYAVASASLNVAGQQLQRRDLRRNDDDGEGATSSRRTARRPSRSAGARRAAPSSSTRSPTTTRACSTA